MGILSSPHTLIGSSIAHSPLVNPSHILEAEFLTYIVDASGAFLIDLMGNRISTRITTEMEGDLTFVVDETGAFMLDDSGNQVISFVEPEGAVFVVDENGDYIVDANGNRVIIAEPSAEIFVTDELGQFLVDEFDNRVIEIIDPTQVFIVDENGDLILDMFGARLVQTAYETDAEALLAEFMGQFDSSTIIGSAPVTAWNNKNLLFSELDINVVAGVGANLTTSALNGNTGILNAGSVGLETTAGILISSPATIFAVFKPTIATPLANQFLFSARSNVAASMQVLTSNSNADKYRMNQGMPINITQAFDTDLRVITAQFRGDTSSKLTISDLGSITGNAGSEDLDFGSIFMEPGGGNVFAGLFLAFYITGPTLQLNEEQISRIQLYLLDKYS